MNATLEGWLDEGLQHYTAGDPGRALAAWYRVLDVDPGNAAALQYIGVVRQVYRLGTATRTPPAQGPVSVDPVSLDPVSVDPAVNASDDFELTATPTPSPGMGLATLGGGIPSEASAADAPATFDIDVGPDSASWISSSWGDVAMGEAAPAAPPAPPVAPPAVPRAVSTVMPEPEPPKPVSVVTVQPVLAPPRPNIVPPLAAVDIQPLDIIVTPLPRPMVAAAIVDGPVRMSVMFDEPRPSTFARTQPPQQAEVRVASAAVVMPVVTERLAPSNANDGPSPWDDSDGPNGSAIVLERRSEDNSPFRKMFASRTSSSIVRTPGSDNSAAFEPLTTPPSAPIDVNPNDEDAEQLMAAAREYAELGDFSNSLELIEQVLELNPAHEGARLYLQRNEATLEKMYESKLGGLHNIPRQVIDANEVIWMSLHHRAGFILSQVDGSLTFADVLEVSGMPRLATLKILADLMTHGVIGVA